MEPHIPTADPTYPHGPRCVARSTQRQRRPANYDADAADDDVYDDDDAAADDDDDEAED